MSIRNNFTALLFAVAFAGSFWGSAFCATAAEDPRATGRNETIEAGVIKLYKEKTPFTATLSGQALAEEKANIRPLVDGVITGILYKAGSVVKEGTPLFQIENESYLADLDVAKAALESAKAALPSAKETLARYEKLAGTGVAQSEVDTARTNFKQAEAAVRSAEADLKTAIINLDRTTIKSPINGVAETADVSLGDLVTAGQSDVLTTVTRLDPINVDLSEPSSRFMERRKKVESGGIKRGSSIECVLILENGEIYERNGVVENIGSNVSTTTGTLTVRVRFENPDRLILPGEFLRVKLTLGTLQGYLVPQLAAEPQVDGTISVWVLVDGNKAQKKILTPEGNTDTAWIVTGGLEEGASIIVDNIDKLKDGAPVAPLAVHIDPHGVIRDTATAEDDNHTKGSSDKAADH